MHLLNVHTLKLNNFRSTPPPYAILSHTWYEDGEEILYLDLINDDLDNPQKAKGRNKTDGCIIATKEAGYDYVWIDTCCINKHDAVELSEAITSMFRWYKKAAICFVYLSDVSGIGDPTSTDSEFSRSRWFTRGWTLQELIAPNELYFYTKYWDKIATKQELCRTIETITGIPSDLVRDSSNMDCTSVAQRMSWAANRGTKREEDRAYSLFGLFGVNLSARYGEGGRGAFVRLQTAILSTVRDDSIFAWGLLPQIEDNECTSPTSPRYFGEMTPRDSIWASSPADFRHCSKVSRLGNPDDPVSNPTLSEGILILFVATFEHCGVKYCVLNCGPENQNDIFVCMPIAPSVGHGGTPNAFLIRPGDKPSKLILVPKTIGAPARIQVLPNKTILRDLMIQRSWVDIKFFTTPHVLVDKYPQELWRGSSAQIPTVSELSSSRRGTQWCIARFRPPRETTDKMVLLVLEINARNGVGHESVRCHLMSVLARTRLSDVYQDLDFMRSQAFGRHSILFGGLATVARLTKETKCSFVVSLTTGSEIAVHDADDGVDPVDADFEIAHVENKRQLVAKLSIKDNLVEFESLARGKADAVNQSHMSVISQIQDLEDQIEALKQQHSILAKDAAQLDHEIKIAEDDASVAKTELENAESEIQSDIATIDSLEGAIEGGLWYWMESAVAAHRGDTVLWHNSLDVHCLGAKWRITPRSLSCGGWTPGEEFESRPFSPIGEEVAIPINELVGVEPNIGQASDTDTNAAPICCPASQGFVVRAIYHGRLEEATRLKLHSAAGGQLCSEAKGWLLIHATRENNYAMANFLINWECDIDILDAHQQTALMYAVRNNNPSLVRLLLDKGASTMADREHPSPLQLYMLPHAILNSNDAVAQLLIDYSVDLNEYRHSLDTPLTAAVKKGNPNITQQLLGKGALTTAKDFYGNLPIAHAVWFQNTEIVRLLLAAGSVKYAEFIAEGKAKYSIAGIAALLGNCDILKLLFEDTPNYADLERQYMSDHCNPVIVCAARGGSLQALKLLISNGFKITTRSMVGHTALLCAADKGHEEIVKYILSTFSSYNLGRSVFEHAAFRNKMKVAKMLVKCGAVPEQRTFHDDPIKLAEKKGHAEMAAYLRSKCMSKGGK